MIENIVKDAIPFLGLALVILTGFALALHVLFRGVTEDEDMDKALDEAFGSFPKSMLSCFYALLGTFEPEVPLLYFYS